MMSSNVLEYRGYTTFIKYSVDDECLYGKIEGIRSTILFDDSEKPIADSFHEAVDEYLDYCEQSGLKPEKPYKGSWNIRVSSDLHRKVAIKAELEHTTINHITEEALLAYV